MAIISTVPRRSVNLPADSIFTLIGSALGGRLIDGPEHDSFLREMAAWLGVPHVFGASSGRSAFQLALMEPLPGKSSNLVEVRKSNLSGDVRKIRFSSGASIARSATATASP